MRRASSAWLFPFASQVRFAGHSLEWVFVEAMKSKAGPFFLFGLGVAWLGLAGVLWASPPRPPLTPQPPPPPPPPTTPKP